MGQEPRNWAAQKAVVNIGQGRLGILTISKHPDRTPNPQSLGWGTGCGELSSEEV